MISRPFFKKVYAALVIIVLSSCGNIKHETVFEGYSSQGVHCRGLQIANNQIVVSGERGVISVFDLEGNALERDMIEGVEDFRDVMVFGDSSMLLLNSSNNAKIVLRRPGIPQKTVYTQSGAFLDGMDFWDEQNGMVYGDPVRNGFLVLKTTNGGLTWSHLSPGIFPQPEGEEAGFAASGTGIDCIGDSTVYFGTGMCEHPRLLVSNDRGESWEERSTPMKGGDSYGIYSLYFWSRNKGMIIGGSYVYDEDKDSICFYTADGGKTWIDRSGGLGGYCSTVQGRSDGKLLVASGRTATYYSRNQGKTWKLLTDKKYYACAVSDTHIVLSGKDGVFRIIRYKL